MFIVADLVSLNSILALTIGVRCFWCYSIFGNNRHTNIWLQSEVKISFKSAETTIEMTSIGTSNIENETELKKKMSKSKSSFTLYRNILLLLIEEQGLPKSEVSSACRKMDWYMESSMEVMSQLADIYIRNKHFDKGAKIVNKMEKNRRRIPLCI